MEKIKKLIKKVCTKEVILYGVFGILTTLINWGAFALLTRFANMEKNLANAIAIILAVLVAYATNKDLVSHTRGGSDKGISSFLLIGLIVSLVCGVGTLALSVALTIFYDGVWAAVASVIFVAVIVGGVTFVATWQLKKDLNAKFYSLI